MTNRTSFSDAEWALINDTLAGVGLVATALDVGVVSAVKEFRALVRTMVDAQSAYAGVELITAMVAEAETNKRSDSPPDAPGVGFVDGILAKVPEAVRTVDAKATPDEAQAYRRLLREVARATTEASGSGVFGTGEKVSDDERAFLTRLDQAIG
ncbi:MAG: hypothetical protein EOO75_20475 [Myxococcales bacterium]|nr:MAG: hypothetical protein EOO75_20475 [Myxococcales bacterium]